MDQPAVTHRVLPVASLLGGLTPLDCPTPMAGARGYEGRARGDGLAYNFPAGTLAGLAWLSTDLLLEGDELVTFILKLRAGAVGPEFRLTFGCLNQAQARLRVPLRAVNQNQWFLGREGAMLKLLCGGDRVDLARVDRMSLTAERTSGRCVRWWQTDFTASIAEPALLTEPLLPKGKLLDELGQHRLRQWPGKTRSADELAQRLKGQLAQAPSRRWPAGFSRWGGWTERRSPATGFFRCEQADGRWWLVDPEGYRFWSAGCDCVDFACEGRVTGLEQAVDWLPPRNGLFQDAWDKGHQSVDFLRANFIRVFGKTYRADWATIALSMLKDFGFNTIGNWSDWQVAQAAGFPYVRPLAFVPTRTPMVYRDFPDVFDPALAADAADFARQLEPTVTDPALIGYFLMNEPNWGFAGDSPAEGMLFNCEQAHTRQALADWLAARHGDDAGLSRAWGVATGLAAIRHGRWRGTVTAGARADLEGFSTRMIERLFHTLSKACKDYDPNHLNLGARYYTAPPPWALAGMGSFDIFSINCYRHQVPADELARIGAATGRPTLIGEWHFGALDVGLAGSGIGYVATQAERGKAYRVYLEAAAALPWCVGVHWFVLYDQSALGRFDGENYNIGFLDVCQRPYAALASAARRAHERMYPVAAGLEKPCADAPVYLPALFL